LYVELVGTAQISTTKSTKVLKRGSRPGVEARDLNLQSLGFFPSGSLSVRSSVGFSGLVKMCAVVIRSMD